MGLAPLAECSSTHNTHHLHHGSGHLMRRVLSGSSGGPCTHGQSCASVLHTQPGVSSCTIIDLDERAVAVEEFEMRWVLVGEGDASGECGGEWSGVKLSEGERREGVESGGIRKGCVCHAGRVVPAQSVCHAGRVALAQRATPDEWTPTPRLNTCRASMVHVAMQQTGMRAAAYDSRWCSLPARRRVKPGGAAGGSGGPVRRSEHGIRQAAGMRASRGSRQRGPRPDPATVGCSCRAGKPCSHPHSRPRTHHHHPPTHSPTSHHGRPESRTPSSRTGRRGPYSTCERRRSC